MMLYHICIHHIPPSDLLKIREDQFFCLSAGNGGRELTFKVMVVAYLTESHIGESEVIGQITLLHSFFGKLSRQYR